MFDKQYSFLQKILYARQKHKQAYSPILIVYGLYINIDN